MTADSVLSIPSATAPQRDASSTPPPHKEYPYVKNPKLGVSISGWQEQPFTMVIFWIGMFQLACLASWVVLLLGGLHSLIGSTSRTLALILVATPMLQQPVGRLVVKLVVHQLDTVWTMLLLRFFATKEEAIVHDGLPFGKDIGLLRTIYNNKGHKLFIVYPCKEQDSWLKTHNSHKMQYSCNNWNLKLANDDSEIETTLQDKAIDKGGKEGHAVVYVHGGGFVAANAAVLLQEAVTMTREGMTVYALDYPLAPDDPFPNAIASILDAFKWLRKHRNVRRVTIVGDSAGGSLACYAASLVSSPRLMEAFVTETGQPTLDNDMEQFPTIVGLVSVYGVLDTESYKARLHSISWLEWKIAVHGLTFCLDCYTNKALQFPQHISALLTNPKTLSLMDFQTFPPTLLVCGALDPLVHSTQAVAKKFQELGVCTTLKLYAGRHGFVGLPRAWMPPDLRSQAAQADTTIRNFLKDRNRHQDRPTMNKLASAARCRLFGGDIAATVPQDVDDGNKVVSSRRH
jgi:acetyl esterase/lipase